jgi:hypothetical protein
VADLRGLLEVKVFAASFITFDRREIALSLSSPFSRPRRDFWPGRGTSEVIEAGHPHQIRVDRLDDRRRLDAVLLVVLLLTQRRRVVSSIA